MHLSMSITTADACCFQRTEGFVKRVDTKHLVSFDKLIGFVEFVCFQVQTSFGTQLSFQTVTTAAGPRTSLMGHMEQVMEGSDRSSEGGWGGAQLAPRWPRSLP